RRGPDRAAPPHRPRRRHRLAQPHLPGDGVMAVLDTPRPAPVQRAAPRTRLTLVPEPTAPSMADPGRLLELAAGGDLAAFARFYDLLAPRAYGLAPRVLRDPGYAEATVQEVFL